MQCHHDLVVLNHMQPYGMWASESCAVKTLVFWISCNPARCYHLKVALLTTVTSRCQPGGFWTKFDADQPNLSIIWKLHNMKSFQKQESKSCTAQLTVQFALLGCERLGRCTDDAQLTSCVGDSKLWIDCVYWYVPLKCWAWSKFSKELLCLKVSIALLSSSWCYKWDEDGFKEFVIHFIELLDRDEKIL